MKLQISFAYFGESFFGSLFSVHSISLFNVLMDGQYLSLQIFWFNFGFKGLQSSLKSLIHHLFNILCGFHNW